MTISNTFRTSRLAVAGVVAAGTLLVPSVGTAAPADSTATAAATASAGDELRPRLELACLRIPNLTLRTERLLERLQADADTLGSLAWLEVQIERAKQAGRDQFVTVLENRLAVRTAYVPVLRERLVRLDALAARCRELGVGL